ncbi:MAG: hypothetical protein ACHQJX_10085 [Candidatus Acidiferrales bacterium]
MYANAFPRSHSSSQSNPQKSAAPAKSTKVWTNDNLANLKGGISVVGKGASASSTTRPNFAYGAQTDEISIISPSDGAVVHPGETISVEVEVASDLKLLSGVAIRSPMGIGGLPKQSPPYTFKIQIPASDGPGSSGPLIGPQPIFAVGAASGRRVVESAPVTLDVEKPDLPVSLTAQMPTLFFKSVGEILPLIMLAKFPDGSIFEVNESTNFSFASSDPGVATVDGHGVVTSSGPGNASIFTTYALDRKKVEARVPVDVRILPAQRFVPH